MSASLPKADMLIVGISVRYVPLTDIRNDSSPHVRVHGGELCVLVTR